MKTKIEEIMSTALATVKSTDGLLESYIKMKENKIRHLPVKDSHGDVIGIISDRDFQRARQSVPSNSGNDVDFSAGSLVRDYMCSEVKSVPFDTELITVVREMIDSKISAVLITSEDKTIGIVTHEDLLKVLADSLYPVEDKVVGKIKNWLSKTPIGEVARTLALNGI